MEYGIPTTLETPLGNLVFNDYAAVGGYLRLSEREGGDSGRIRTAVEPVPQRDFAIVHDAFEGEVVETLRGQIAFPDGDLSSRRALEDALRSKTKSLKREDGILRWTPSGAAERRRIVRLYQGVVITGAILKEFQFSLVAGDPLSYAVTEQNLATTAVGGTLVRSGPSPWFYLFLSDPGGDAVIVNGGTAPTYPRVRLHGPATGPAVANLQTGEYVFFPTLTLLAGEYVEVDMRAETAKLNGVTNVLGTLDMANSDFWALLPGSNTVQMSAGGADANTKATVYWRNAWDG